MKICLIDETGTGDGALSVLAARWGLEHDEDNLMALVLTPEHLELRKRDEPKLGGIFVDFVGGAMAHRRKFGGGRGRQWRKRWALKAIICRMWWMPLQDLGAMPCVGFSRLPRADAGA
ncbi:hypothetical protein ECZU34_26040 [Escherichia coli]|nr:hypothetical protein ECZU34_26040 [Escherichia coli]